MLENTVIFKGIKIKYLFKPSTKDCSHLIIIFSGFGSKSPFAYDFSGKSLINVSSNILWLKDDSNGMTCYYLNNSDIINEFIQYFAIRNGCNIETITLVGGSKGGTAALYYGLKYEYKNIISSAPILKIRSTVLKNRKIYDETINNIRYDGDLDKIIYDVAKNSNRNKNIYIISSDVDEYEKAESIDEIFNGFDNYNHFKIRSDILQSHNQITKYSLPIILSIVYSNSFHIYPKYECRSEVTMSKGGNINYNIISLRERNEGIAILDECIFSDGKMFPKGVALVKGYEESLVGGGYRNYSKSIVLTDVRNGKCILQERLGTLRNNNYSLRFYDKRYVDYEYAGFASYHLNGIDVSCIPFGIYSISVELSYETLGKRLLNLKTKDVFCSALDKDGSIVRILPYNETVLFAKLRPVSNIGSDFFVNLISKESDNLVHYEGYFIRYGIRSKEWNDVDFYLVFVDNDSGKTFVFNYGKLKDNNFAKKNNFIGDYYVCKYCSIGRKGVDVSSLGRGSYSVYITMMSGVDSFSEKITDCYKKGY